MVQEARGEREKVKVVLNGKERYLTKGLTVLQACNEISPDMIPYLCNHPRLPRAPGTCRFCQVEVDGKMKISCNLPIAEGMVINTASQDISEPSHFRLPGALAGFVEQRARPL